MTDRKDGEKPKNKIIFIRSLVAWISLLLTRALASTENQYMDYLSCKYEGRQEQRVELFDRLVVKGFGMSDI